MIFLGKRYSDQELNTSFDFIEDFIAREVSDWSVAPNTAEIERQFSEEIKAMSKEDFCLLLTHSGYIPEMYLPDSSQETLYSKLIESLVCQWAIRIGFSDSFLQTQKSNKEDVTIKVGNQVIVCDAKSLRLGRSQAAPNVKDTIKKQAYKTWLDQHDCNRIGGLVTFPSLHDWKRGSEAYFYFSEGNPSIMMLFYEHLAFILKNNINSSSIINFLNSYNTIFSSPSNSRALYWNALENSLFGKFKEEYNSFIQIANSIARKKVSHAINKLNDYLAQKRIFIDASMSRLTYDQLKERAVEAQYAHECSNIERQKDNIIRLRPHD